MHAKKKHASLEHTKHTYMYTLKCTQVAKHVAEGARAREEEACASGHELVEDVNTQANTHSQ